MSNICSFYGVNADTYRKYYKKIQSGLKEWNQYSHCEKYMIFPENIGNKLSIDEVSLSKGELYTFITNKSAKGKKNSIVACINSTKAEEISRVLKKIPIEKRKLVEEITLDMAPNMSLASKECFPMATLVIDRFHVIRLAIEALQGIRTKLRWNEMDEENKQIKKARELKVKYKPFFLSNGDTTKALLARSKFILAKKENEWTGNQKERSKLLFCLYPQLKVAYDHTIKLRAIYENKDKIKALIEIQNWIKITQELKIEQFNSVANSIQNHSQNILNFFNNRSTNANAESFNSKIKLFRANIRGVTDTRFFLFRLMKLFA